jgi:hypothetical protein
MTGELSIIKETRTKGIGPKALIRTRDGYELRCMWQGGASIFLTPEELAAFGPAMTYEAACNKWRD